MNSSTTLFLFIFIIIISLTASTPAIHSKPTAYEVLQHYGFPIGLLPKGVSSYELNRETGEFSVHLDETCSFPVQSYQLRYRPTITGVISENKLKNLKGVSVKVLFFWLSIVEVDHQGNYLEFSVGLVSAEFAVENFLERPQCGCGFDCNGLDGLSSAY